MPDSTDHHALHAVAERWVQLANVPLHPGQDAAVLIQTAASLMAETCRAMAETCRAMAAEGVEPYPQSAPCDRCSDEVKTHVALCTSCYAKALPMALAGDGPCGVAGAFCDWRGKVNTCSKPRGHECPVQR